MTRRRSALLAGVVLVALLLAACGDDDGGVKTSTGDPTVASTSGDQPSATTTAPVPPGGTVSPDAAGVDLRVVFLRNGKVATAHRRVAPTTAVGRAALEQLVAGPDASEQALGFTNGLAAGTKVDGIDIADGVATVAFTPAITDPAARAQIVYTLTQFPTVQKVRFGTSGPTLTRDDVRDVTPLVFLESVAPGDVVKSPVRVAGDSNTFEATVRIRVLGADGSVLADTFTTATSGTGTWGTFAQNVEFAKGANTEGKIVVFWDSPEDGSPRDVTEVPVRFA